jgi:hypothetical protein
MISVHESKLQEHLARGQVVVGWIRYAAGRDDRAQTSWPSFIRALLCDPERTCLQSMRGWQTAYGDKEEICLGRCRLDKGHRGRCATVVFHCDLCGKGRRGSPAYQDENVAACWMCYGLPKLNPLYGVEGY